MRRSNRPTAAILAALTLAAGSVSAGTATLEFFGEGIIPTDVSENASVIVGNVIFDNSYETWRWVAGDPAGWQRLGRATVPLCGNGAGSPDVSNDGEHVSATIADVTLTWEIAGLWTDGAGWHDTVPPIPPDGDELDGAYSDAWGLSGDGSTLTGLYWHNTGRGKPCYWRLADGTVPLPVNTGRSGRVNASNYDGTVVAGWEETPTGPWRPTAWRNGVKHTLTDTPIMCMAEAINTEGSIIVGNTYNEQAARRNAARWDWNGSSYVLTDLGVLPGTPQTFIARVWASSVSDDGTIITGQNRFQDNGPFSLETSFVWTAPGGMRSIEDVLADHGLAFPENWKCIQALVTPDGSAIAGACVNLNEPAFFDYRPFILRFVPLPPCADINDDQIVDTADLGLLVGDFGSVGPSEPADLNGDGVVDTADLGLLIEGFGEECF